MSQESVGHSTLGMKLVGDAVLDSRRRDVLMGGGDDLFCGCRGNHVIAGHFHVEAAHPWVREVRVAP